LKGSACRVVAYDHPCDRCSVDIDLGIPKQYIHDAEQLAMAQGFIQAEWNPRTKRFSRGSPLHRASVEAQHYELGFLARDQAIGNLDIEMKEAIFRTLPYQDPWHQTQANELACYVTLDLHHGLTVDCSVDGPLASSSYVTRGRLRLRVPDPEWLIFHLVHKLYLEGIATYRKGGYQYADLIRLVTLLDESNAAKLIHLLSTHGLEIPAFYVLRPLITVFEMKLPSPLEELLERRRYATAAETDAHQSNDLGGVWPKLWGYRE
jgi:hypothetical protein